MSNIYKIEKKKYGIDIWSYLYGFDIMNTDYDGWTFQAKTRRTREKHFNDLFGGPKTNFQLGPFCKN